MGLETDWAWLDRILLFSKFEIALRYILHFPEGRWNASHEGIKGCSLPYFSQSCNYANRLIGVQQLNNPGVAPATPSQEVGPVAFVMLIPDLLLLLFLALHRASLERLGLWE